MNHRVLFLLVALLVAAMACKKEDDTIEPRLLDVEFRSYGLSAASAKINDVEVPMERHEDIDHELTEYLTGYAKCSPGAALTLVSGNNGGHIRVDGAVLVINMVQHIDTVVTAP